MRTEFRAAGSHPRAAAPCADSVGMGLRPAQVHEEPWFVGQAILPADSLSADPAACKAACFFEPWEDNASDRAPVGAEEGLTYAPR
jgi:hypothetical protein